MTRNTHTTPDMLSTSPARSAAPALPKLVERTVQRLVRAFAPEQIILFGSYAKGTTHIRSDVDLLVVTNIPVDRGSHMKRVRQLTSDCFPQVDIVFATPTDLVNAKTAKSPFLLSVLGTGISIYRHGD